jgi:hypothetical protein
MSFVAVALKKKIGDEYIIFLKARTTKTNSFDVTIVNISCTAM